MANGAVSWSSKLQSVVALSTTEAEYVAAVSTGTEAIWMRSFLGELGYDMSGASLINMDNQSAIAVGRNPEHHGRMKHLNLRLFWLRDAVEAKRLRLEFIPTREMVADALTKALPRQAMEECRALMGLRE